MADDELEVVNRLLKLREVRQDEIPSILYEGFVIEGLIKVALDDGHQTVTTAGQVFRMRLADNFNFVVDLSGHQIGGSYDRVTVNLRFDKMFNETILRADREAA